jgi:hypothetical protein
VLIGVVMVLWIMKFHRPYKKMLAFTKQRDKSIWLISPPYTFARTNPILILVSHRYPILAQSKSVTVQTYKKGDSVKSFSNPRNCVKRFGNTEIMLNAVTTNEIILNVVTTEICHML